MVSGPTPFFFCFYPYFTKLSKLNSHGSRSQHTSSGHYHWLLFSAFLFLKIGHWATSLSSHVDLTLSYIIICWTFTSSIRTLWLFYGLFPDKWYRNECSLISWSRFSLLIFIEASTKVYWSMFIILYSFNSF